MRDPGGHTEGPWTWAPERCRIRGSDGSIVVDCLGSMSGSGDTAADARLIASAPAMRAALERIRDSDKHAGGTFVLELQQIARAALALADGAS